MTQVITNKPSSLEEKRQVTDAKEFVQRRWLFVHELKSMLDEFEDDDWVEVNQVGNLNIGRGDNPIYATIDFLWAEIERWNGEE